MLKTAIIQNPPVFLNLDQSLAKAIQLLNEAADNGAQLVVFPETWLPGYPVWLDSAPNAAVWNDKGSAELFRHLYENSLDITSPGFDLLFDAATDRQIILVIGVNERSGGSIYNTIISINGRNGETIFRRKLVPTFSEKLVWGMGSGEGLGVLQSEFGNIGAMICWEHWMPLLRSAYHGFNESVHIAQWPTAHELHQLASRHYAFEGACFVIASGCTMTKQEALDGLMSLDDYGKEALAMLESIPLGNSQNLLNGGSAVIDPKAAYILEPVYNYSGIIYSEIDLKMIAEAKYYLDTSGHYSRPDIFQLDIKNLNSDF